MEADEAGPRGQARSAAAWPRADTGLAGRGRRQAPSAVTRPKGFAAETAAMDTFDLFPASASASRAAVPTVRARTAVPAGAR